MSTLSQAFVGYLRSFGIVFPAWSGIFGFLSVLFFINLRGIHHSSVTNMVSTTIEAGGLIIVLYCGFSYLLQPGHPMVVTPLGSMPTVRHILMGAGLAFFAFTGFEDLVNVAEEARQPTKNIPRAILFSIGLAGLLYLSVSWVATAVVPGSVLGRSHAPLLDVVKAAQPAMPSFIFSVIAIFAVSNTTLLNYITASRLLYGMSKARLLPRFLQGIHPRYHTPWKAIFAIFPVILGLGLSGTLAELAASTSVVVLIVFSFSCIALITVKLKENHQKKNLFRIPIVIPMIAVVLNMAMIGFLPVRSILTAVGFMVAGLIVSLWITGSRSRTIRRRSKS